MSGARLCTKRHQEPPGGRIKDGRVSRVESEGGGSRGGKEGWGPVDIQERVESAADRSWLTDDAPTGYL